MEIEDLKIAVNKGKRNLIVFEDFTSTNNISFEDQSFLIRELKKCLDLFFDNLNRISLPSKEHIYIFMHKFSEFIIDLTSGIETKDFDEYIEVQFSKVYSDFINNIFPIAQEIENKISNESLESLQKKIRTKYPIKI